MGCRGVVSGSGSVASAGREGDVAGWESVGRETAAGMRCPVGIGRRGGGRGMSVGDGTVGRESGRDGSVTAGIGRCPF